MLRINLLVGIVALLVCSSCFFWGIAVDDGPALLSVHLKSDPADVLENLHAMVCWSDEQAASFMGRMTFPDSEGDPLIQKSPQDFDVFVPYHGNMWSGRLLTYSQGRILVLHYDKVRQGHRIHQCVRSDIPDLRVTKAIEISLP